MRHDSAIEDPQQDTLGRDPVAAELAANMYRLLPDARSVTVGLVAPWGWGKSTFLHLLEKASHKLRQVDAVPLPVVLWFHPWWFSGREDFYLQFFHALKKQAGAVDRNLWRSADSFVSWLGAFCALVPYGGKTQPLFNQIEKTCKKRASEAGSLEKLKATAAEKLRKTDRQVWVFVDDLDRVDPKTLVLFLSLVRSMADLPWIRYFIAYDKNSLKELLVEEVFPGCGPENPRISLYAEKFIQVEIDLPLLVDGDDSYGGRCDWIKLDGRNQTPEWKDVGAIELAFPPPVRKFGVNGYLTEQFSDSIDQVAWVRTYVEGLRKPSSTSGSEDEAADSSGTIPTIETPRQYARWYNSRSLLERFHTRALLADVELVTTCLEKTRLLDDFILEYEQTTGRSWVVSMGRAIEDALVRAGQPRAALEKSHAFRGAWARRAHLVYPVKESEGLEEIDKSAGSVLIEKIEKGETQKL